MRYVKSLIVVFTVALPILAAQIARADGLDESMTFTFRGPVEIPGKVLPGGDVSVRARRSEHDSECRADPQ